MVLNCYYNVPKSGPKVKERATKQQLRKIFLECDADDNKVLTKEEVKKAFDRFGALFPGFRAWEALRVADQNGDRCISMEELDNLIDHAYQLAYVNVS